MAIIYTKQRNIQRILILVFAAVLLITVIVIWQGFSGEEEEAFLEKFFLSRQEVKIDFDFLRNPLLGELRSFSEIEPLGVATSTGETEGGVGRTNPFIPY